VFGAVQVARDMIERSTGLYGGDVVGRDPDILTGLIDAAETLNPLAAAPRRRTPAHADRTGRVRGGAFYGSKR
jgi:hypothetical protein